MTPRRQCLLFIQARSGITKSAFGGYKDISDANMAFKKPMVSQEKQDLYLSASKTK